MASGALPPGFPPVEIDGQLYWDGGIVSNTPLQHVLERQRTARRDRASSRSTCSAPKGPCRRTCSRSRSAKRRSASPAARASTPIMFRELQAIRRAVRRLRAKLPDELKESGLAASRHDRQRCAVTIVQLIYRHAAYGRQSNDYEFSRLHRGGTLEGRARR